MNEPNQQDDSQTRGDGTDGVGQHHESHDDNPDRAGDHRTGQRQAAENAENEPPG